MGQYDLAQITEKGREAFEDYQRKRFGQRYTEYRRLWYKPWKDLDPELDFPLYITLETSFACNLRCPSCVHGEAGIQSLVALLRSFVSLGGIFVHVDVVDSDMLRDAQRHPDKYPHLAVRVSGWSARFVTLDRDWQEMIINRTTQKM